MTYHLIIYDTINGQSGLKDNMYILIFPTNPNYESVDNNLLSNVRIENIIICTGQ